VAEKSRYGFNLRVGQIMRVGPFARALSASDGSQDNPTEVFFRRPLYPHHEKVRPIPKTSAVVRGHGKTKKLDDAICWSGVALELSARMLCSDRRH